MVARAAGLSRTNYTLWTLGKKRLSAKTCVRIAEALDRLLAQTADAPTPRTVRRAEGEGRRVTVRLDLRGLLVEERDEAAEGLNAVDLEDIFVPPRFRRVDGSEEISLQQLALRISSQSADDRRPIQITGMLGSGKTTVLRHLAATLQQSAQGTLLKSSLSAASLLGRELARAGSDTTEFCRLLEAARVWGAAPTDESVEDAFREGRACLLLDDLDTVEPDERGRLRDTLDAASQRCLVITAQRSVPARPPPVRLRLEDAWEVAPLAPADRVGLLKSYLSILKSDETRFEELAGLLPDGCTALLLARMTLLLHERRFGLRGEAGRLQRLPPEILENAVEFMLESWEGAKREVWGVQPASGRESSWDVARERLRGHFEATLFEGLRRTAAVAPDPCLMPRLGVPLPLATDDGVELESLAQTPAFVVLRSTKGATGSEPWSFRREIRSTRWLCFREGTRGVQDRLAAGVVATEYERDADLGRAGWQRLERRPWRFGALGSALPAIQALVAATPAPELSARVQTILEAGIRIEGWDGSSAGSDSDARTKLWCPLRLLSSLELFECGALNDEQTLVLARAAASVYERTDYAILFRSLRPYALGWRQAVGVPEPEQLWAKADREAKRFREFHREGRADASRLALREWFAAADRAWRYDTEGVLLDPLLELLKAVVAEMNEFELTAQPTKQWIVESLRRLDFAQAILVQEGASLAGAPIRERLQDSPWLTSVAGTMNLRTVDPLTNSWDPVKWVARLGRSARTESGFSAALDEAGGGGDEKDRPNPNILVEERVELALAALFVTRPDVFESVLTRLTAKVESYAREFDPTAEPAIQPDGSDPSSERRASLRIAAVCCVVLAQAFRVTAVRVGTPRHRLALRAFKALRRISQNEQLRVEDDVGSLQVFDFSAIALWLMLAPRMPPTYGGTPFRPLLPSIEFLRHVRDESNGQGTDRPREPRP